MMEINSISNSNLNQFDYSKKLQNLETQNNNTVTAKSEIISTPQEIKNISAISPTIKGNIENISLIQQTQQQLSEQENLINKLDTVINNSSDINTQSVEVNKIFESYNNNGKVIYSNLNELVDDQNSEKSYSYFDGVLGSKPMSFEKINEASTKQRELVANLNNTLEQNLQKEVEYSKKLISQQQEQTLNSSPFKEIDFGKESANFSSNNIHNISSSLVSVQSSTVQKQSIGILA